MSTDTLPLSRPVTTCADPVGPEAIARFRAEGVLVPAAPVFPAARLAALQDRFAALQAAWLAVSGRTPEAMDVPHFVAPDLLDWLLDEAVLALVRPHLGHDLALFSSHFIAKPAGIGKRVPWHEDSAYWAGTFTPMEVVTVWLALDRSDVDNGCMRVVPGSHQRPDSHYREVEDRSASVFDSEIEPEAIDEADVRDVVLTEGCCSLHDARLIHGSRANLGTRRRCGYTMRFISARTLYTPKRVGQHLYLASGTDHHNQCRGQRGMVNEVFLAANPHYADFAAALG